jgi:hypothetical protein
MAAATSIAAPIQRRAALVLRAGGVAGLGSVRSDAPVDVSEAILLPDHLEKRITAADETVSVLLRGGGDSERRGR